MCLTSIVHQFLMSDKMLFDLDAQRGTLEDSEVGMTTLLGAKLLHVATIQSERFKELVFHQAGFNLIDSAELKQRLTDIKDVKG